MCCECTDLTSMKGDNFMSVFITILPVKYNTE